MTRLPRRPLRRGRRSPAGLVAALAAVAGAPDVAAHHLWLQPSAFSGAPGAPVAVELRIGDEMPGEPVAARPETISRMALLTSAGEREVRALPAGSPAGLLTLAEAGDQVLVLTSGPSVSVLPAERFEAYLAEEGLVEVARRRAAAGRSGEPGREAFSRALKVLLRCGDGGSGSLHERPVGLPLELVPHSSPADLAPGGELSFTLLRAGRPQGGVLVEAVSAAAPEAVYSRRSDARGQVRFQFPRPGMWRLTAVHMEPAERPDADWASVWSALTFAIGH
jgi:uncharacterized GH25 family protein